MKKYAIFALMFYQFSLPAASQQCVDPRDKFDDYDVTAEKPQNNRSDFYVLNYTWAKNHCKSLKPAAKEPGARDFLQCGSGRQFGYILHGLWPQGTMTAPLSFPQFCEGEKPKIERAILEKYLCMTPSLGLMQHEYEKHGTCMHDANLRTPDG